MATQTSNYNLVKPATTEAIDVTQLNGNMDIIDGAMAGMQGSLNETVKFSSQSLTDAQKEQARTNIGVPSQTQAVMVSEQVFSTEQMAMARQNIGAASADDMSQWKTVTTEQVTMNYGLTAQVKKIGRVCMVAITGQMNTSVSQWAIIGSGFPHPLMAVIVPICGGGSAGDYLDLAENGVLQTGVEILSGAYVLITFTYITAN